MLPARDRMNRAEFSEFSKLSTKNTIYNRIGTLVYLYTKKRKFSVVTSKKNEKSAVKRNKLRRRAYSLFDQSGVMLSGIFYPSKVSYNTPFPLFKQSLNELLEKTKKNTLTNP